MNLRHDKRVKNNKIKFLEKKKLKEMAKRQTKKNQPAKQKNPIPICHTNQPGKGRTKKPDPVPKKTSVSSKKR